MRSHRLLVLLASLLLVAPDLTGQETPENQPSTIQSAIHQALDTAAPWTVRIEALAGSRAGSGPLFDDQGKPPDFNPALDAASTGVLVSSDGLIVTSTINLENNPRILTVLLSDGREFTARVLGKDESRMIAVLRIEADDLPVPEIVPVEAIEPGIWALALGRTFSGSNPRPTVNLGIVSAKGRHGGRALQTDASVNPANYGGPLIDIRGRALGIIVPFSENGGKAGVGFYDSGIGFAIPLADLRPVIDRIAQGQSIAPAFLGIQPTPEFKGPGVQIQRVIDDSAASAAGLRPEDVILTIDGIGLIDFAALQQALGKRFSGDEVQFTIRREDEEIEIPVTLGSR